MSGTCHIGKVARERHLPYWEGGAWAAPVILSLLLGMVSLSLLLGMVTLSLLLEMHYFL